MEFCMNSKEESGHKSIRPALMELSSGSLMHSALCLQCILSRPCSLEEEKGETGSVLKPDPQLEELMDGHYSCPAPVSLVFPGAAVRVEVKPRRGAGVASVTTRKNLPQGCGLALGRKRQIEKQGRAAPAGAAQGKASKPDFWVRNPTWD